MAKDDLFRLVKSLTPSEKRYLFIYNGKSKEVSSYLSLLKAIGTQNSYDEDKLKRKFQSKIAVDQFHVAKYHLKQLILKSLRNYHAHCSKDAELKDILRNIEILYQKELFDHCWKEIKKGEKIATQYELYTSKAELHRWMRRLHQAKAPHDYDKYREQLLAEESCIAYVQNINQYGHLIVDCLESMSNDGSFEDSDWFHLLTDRNNAKSFEASVLHYHAAYFNDLGKGRGEEAETRFYSLLDFMESFPHLLSEEAGLYASSINNFISYQVFNHRNAKAWELIRRVQQFYQSQIRKKHKVRLSKHILRTHSLELELIRQGSDTKDSATLPSIEEVVLNQEKNMPKSYQLSFWFQLANIHFEQGSNTEAFAWVDRILAFKDESIRPDIQIEARFLNLILHWEMRNLFVLRYFVDHTRRFIKKQGKIEPYQKTLLRCFGKLGRAAEEEQKLILQSFMKKFTSDSLPNSPQVMVDYSSWFKRNC